MQLFVSPCILIWSCFFHDLTDRQHLVGGGEHESKTILSFRFCEGRSPCE